MANTRELRRRIKSIKNTSQITKAMQMVAATKMRRAQNQALGGRPYEENLNFSVGTLLPKVDIITHPLLSRHPERSEGSPTNVGISNKLRDSSQARNDRSAGVVLLSTNKSLCGALNTNLFRAVQQKFGQDKDIKYFSYGLKGRNFVVRTGKTLEADFENPEAVIFRQARQITNLVRNAFLEGLVKEVYLAFPDFVSTLMQESKIVKLLPIDLAHLRGENTVDTPGVSAKVSSRLHTGSERNVGDVDSAGEFLFEPNVDELLDYVLVHHIETQIYQALLETKASEHSARMMAMQNATDNALELVEDLNLTYNQTRQAAITNELLEITTAGAAME